MKIAISLPDPLADAVDAFAAAKGLPRSRVIANALVDYLARQSPSKVTERLNAVYALERDGLDAPIAESQRRQLKNSEW
jgi:metal-responsive CopG/Arc/MetJ family transcriptional regulator